MTRQSISDSFRRPFSFKNASTINIISFSAMVKYSICEILYMSQEELLQQTRKKIFEELTKIVDPEIGVSIMELELIDKVDIDSGKVKVDLHLTSPFCPAIFGFKIAQDVRDNIYKLSGVDRVNVNVSNHFMAEAINKQVNESKYPPKPAA
jgi:metal-sulfur cluster biosynthetic enzyme